MGTYAASKVFVLSTEALSEEHGTGVSALRCARASRRRT